MKNEDNTKDNKTNKKGKHSKETTTRKAKNTKNIKHTGRKILLIILLIILILVGWFYYKTMKNGGGMQGVLSTLVGQNEEKRKDLKEIRVLLLGISTDLDSELTDTIMIASYDPNTQKANLLSIPRDTYTGKNPKKATASLKINALYNIDKTPERTLKAVNELTGLDIQYYAVIKNEALRELVDAIGGVKFNVPEDMKYDDPTQNLHINLKKGEQVLDGEKAEWLVRWRHSNMVKGVMTTYPEEYGSNDLGRMRTQRDFIIATLQQTLKPGNIFKIGQILDVAERNIETNLNFSLLKDYVPYAVELNTENIKSATLPGEAPAASETNNVSIFVVDKQATATLIQSMFGTTEDSEDGNTISNSTNSLSGNTTSKNTTSKNTTTSRNTTSNSKNKVLDGQTSKAPSEIRIELLNGSGSTDKLTRAKTLLENAGYTVKSTGKSGKLAKTIITDKKNLTDDDLKEIKNILGVGSISVNPSSTSTVDVTIIIGEDFES